MRIRRLGSVCLRETTSSSRVFSSCGRKGKQEPLAQRKKQGARDSCLAVVLVRGARRVACVRARSYLLYVLIEQEHAVLEARAIHTARVQREPVEAREKKASVSESTTFSHGSFAHFGEPCCEISSRITLREPIGTIG